ncbi:MAG: hypothetical protein LBQ61_06280 [Spirochaetales bacterium]|nr:hypothetical protein [Spirochaetales bacterium]
MGENEVFCLFHINFIYMAGYIGLMITGCGIVYVELKTGLPGVKNQMKPPLLTFIQMLTLIAFTVTSCGSPLVSLLPREASEYMIEIGKGTPYYLYLDKNNNYITTPLGEDEPDPGKTALFVEDNPAAERVLVVAETRAEDDLVRITNRNNESTIYLYFHKGENFPWAMNLKAGLETATAWFFAHNWDTQQYSVMFSKDGQYHTLQNLGLNKTVLNSYVDDPDLSDDQNSRLKNMIVALGIFASLNQVVPVDNVTVRASWEVFRPFMTVIFSAAAVVAVVAAVILATPADIVLPASVFTVSVPVAWAKDDDAADDI